MLKPLRTRGCFARFLAAVALLHIFIGIAMAASPAVHEWIHGDAGGENHECVATVLHSGGTDQALAEPVFAPAILPQQFCSVAEFDPKWIASLFLSQCVLEHAPPAVS